MGRGWKILIGVVAALAILLAINTFVVDGETKSAEVTVPGGRILHLQGGEMQVLERGPRDGSPIVLLHCYTCSIVWWQRLIPLLDRDHRVVALDLRGFGGSEKPGSGYSIEDQATFVAEACNDWVCATPPSSGSRSAGRWGQPSARSRTASSSGS